MNSEPILISEENISLAWANAFLESIKPGVKEISPLIMAVTDFENGVIRENADIRHALDETLKELGKFSSSTTASTIFPLSLWNPDLPAENLYQRYLRILPVIKRICPLNRYGTYFERIIAYGEVKRNQVDYIIQGYRGGNHRRSAAQVAIFDPNHDQTKQPQRGFPCLQQVAFGPSQQTGSLTVVGFYALQDLFNRGYGNLLGLARLGLFVAHEMDLQLTRVTCIASTACYGRKVSRSQLNNLVSQLKGLLENHSN